MRPTGPAVAHLLLAFSVALAALQARADAPELMRGGCDADHLKVRLPGPAQPLVGRVLQAGGGDPCPGLGRQPAVFNARIEAIEVIAIDHRPVAVRHALGPQDSIQDHVHDEQRHRHREPLDPPAHTRRHHVWLEQLEKRPFDIDRRDDHRRIQLVGCRLGPSGPRLEPNAADRAAGGQDPGDVGYRAGSRRRGARSRSTSACEITLAQPSGYQDPRR